MLEKVTNVDGQTERGKTGHLYLICLLKQVLQIDSERNDT